MTFTYKITIIEKHIFSYCNNGIELDSLVRDLSLRGIPYDSIKIEVIHRETEA